MLGRLDASTKARSKLPEADLNYSSVGQSVVLSVQTSVAAEPECRPSTSLIYSLSLLSASSCCSHYRLCYS